MNLKTKRQLYKAFYDFIAIVVAIGGQAAVKVIENAFDEWRSTKVPKPKTIKKRAKRKKSKHKI